VTWHTVVSVYRLTATDSEHKHILGLSAIRQTTGEVLTWLASDLKRYPDAQFLDGTNPARPQIGVTVGPCSVCGEEVIRLDPSELEIQLPESRT
jgi:hypothetical protein